MILCRHVGYDGYICGDCGQIIGNEWTEEEVMQAEAEMELKMLMPAAGIRCHFHPKAPAVKMIHGDVFLCAACCEDISQRIVSGIRRDYVDIQFEQEQDRD
jgi:hypothetical protein